MGGTSLPSHADSEDQPIKKSKFSLENILGDNNEVLEFVEVEGIPADGWDENATKQPVAEGFCIECEGGA